MNQTRQFVFVAAAVFVLTVAAGLLSGPTQDAAAVVYIMVAVVLPAPVAYFVVYLDGLKRVNPFSASSRTGESNRETDSPDSTDRNEPDRDDPDPDPTK